MRIVLYLLGLLGPLVGLAVLANELDIGLFDALLYVASLVTVGYVSLGSLLFALAWLAGRPSSPRWPPAAIRRTRAARAPLLQAR